MKGANARKVILIINKLFFGKYILLNFFDFIFLLKSSIDGIDNILLLKLPLLKSSLFFISIKYSI